MGEQAPGRGATPAQRAVDVPAAPNPLAELISRPARNTQEIGTPDVHAPNAVAPIAAAPIVDVRDLVTRRTGIAPGPAQTLDDGLSG